VCDEENVPAQQSQKKEDSRFSRADEVGWWSPRTQAPARQRPQAPGRLTSSRSEGYPPAIRLRKRREYQAAYQRGVRVPGSHLVLFILESDHGFARLGITATRKVGCAVRRNLVRRRLREIFRRHREQIPSWDLVVNVRVKAVSASFVSLETEFLTQLTRGQRRLRGKGGQR